VVIDFTIAPASMDILKACVKHKVIHVIGTTGFSREQEAEIDKASHLIPIVKSGNYSLGVNVLSVLVEKAAAILGEEFDIEILEMHHKKKVDAPSGTAMLLGHAAAAGRNVSIHDKAVYTREGHTGARNDGDIGFATLRGGTVIGDHDVIFAGSSERLVLSHKAESREMFARGALKAALWAKGKPEGLYSMREVLGL
jgi:4-hydroxy-tetrahydrodipicolinate reductase